MKAAVFTPLHPLGRAQLEKEMKVVYFGWAVKEPVTTPLPSDDEIIAQASDAEIIITPGELSGRVIDNCLHLRLIAVGRGDPRGVDLERATHRGIPVVYAAGRNASAVAEITLAFIIMLLRRLIPANQFVSDNQWKTWDDLFATGLIKTREVKGNVLGLIGFGIIGKEVSQRALPFGMQILVFDPFVNASIIEASGAKKVTLDELLEKSDIISIHCKLTEETRNMIGAEQFSKMKPGVFFINTARAAIVDRNAFLEAVKSGKLAGAALDVYWEEPLPENDELNGMPNLIHTPHIAGATADMDRRTTEIIVAEILTYLRGGRPRFIANPGIYES